MNNYQSGQPNINGNLGPPLANGVRTPTAYSGVNYATPATSSMGYSSPGVPPQYASQNFMPPQLHYGSGPPMGRPAGPPVPQQQYSTGYPSYSSASGQLPPISGIHTQQVVKNKAFSNPLSHQLWYSFVTNCIVPAAKLSCCTCVT